MPIYYKIEKDTKIKTKKGRYVRATTGKTVSDSELVKVIAEISTVSRIDWAAVMAAMSEAIVKVLGNGNRVHLNGIGTFSPSVTGEVYKDKSGRDRARNLQVTGVNFLPDKEIKNGLKHADFKCMRTVGNYIGAVGDDELKQTAACLLEKRSYFTAAEFINALGVSRTRGYRLLKKMVAEGMVSNEGGNYIK